MFQRLLASGNTNKFFATEEVLEAVVRNNESVKEMTILLLEKCGVDLNIAEQVLKEVAGNLHHGKCIMMLLLEERGADIIITQGIVEEAMRDRRNKRPVLRLLLEKRGADMTRTITTQRMEIVAGNESAK